MHIEIFLLLDNLTLSVVFPSKAVIHSCILAPLTVKRIEIYATLSLLVFLWVHTWPKLARGKSVPCILVEAWIGSIHCTCVAHRDSNCKTTTLVSMGGLVLHVQYLLLTLLDLVVDSVDFRVKVCQLLALCPIELWWARSGACASTQKRAYTLGPWLLSRVRLGTICIPFVDSWAKNRLAILILVCCDWTACWMPWRQILPTNL